MNGDLELVRVLDPTQIDRTNYFQSLVEKAKEKGLLADSDMERLRYECLELLREKTEHYNGKDNFTLRIETAQTIMEAVLYTLGISLMMCGHPDEAVEELKTMSTQVLYKRGRNRVDTLIAETKLLHSRICSQLLDTPNNFYRGVAEIDLPEFFEKYNADYGAKSLPVDFDYPILKPLPQTGGITFVKAFAECFYHENRFCCLFDAQNVHHLMCGFAEDYDELPESIFTPVLTTALGCFLVGTEFRRLDLTMQDIDRLEDLFFDKTQPQIESILSDAAARLYGALALSNELFHYIRDCIPIIAGKIADAVRDNAIRRIFCSPAYPEEKPEVVFSFGSKMPDRLYRMVLDSVMCCESLEGKVAIIKGNVHSLGDLEDILLDAELTDEEMQAVLSILDQPELAALFKRYVLNFIPFDTDMQEKEIKLHDNLEHAISSLSLQQQEMIRQFAEFIQDE